MSEQFCDYSASVLMNSEQSSLLYTCVHMHTKARHHVYTLNYTIHSLLSLLHNYMYSHLVAYETPYTSNFQHFPYNCT